MLDRRLLVNFDLLLLGLCLSISLIGLVLIFSASYSVIGKHNLAIFYKQIYWLLIGLLILFTTVLVDYKTWARFAYVVYFFALLILLYLVFLGPLLAGVKRWLIIGSFRFQPAEFAKIALILCLARYLSDRDSGIKNLSQLFFPLLLSAPLLLLILIQPNLGTALAMIPIIVVMIFAASTRLAPLLILAGGGLMSAPVLWLKLKPYQKKRLLSFIFPEEDPLGSGYHAIQSKIAVGSGSFWGKGFLKGSQTQLEFLPEKHSDFIFSVLAEEWGFVGAFILLLLYLLLLLKGLEIALKAKDQLGTLLALGVVAMIFSQVLINIGMVVGIMPITGLPLPIVSAGGSSFITTMFGVGLLININLRRFMF